VEWIERLHGRTVGLDTAPLIYFMEKHQDFIIFVRAFFAALNQGAFTAVTSTITLTEVLVHPLRFKQQELARKYREILMDTKYLRIIPVSPAIAETAAELRAAHALRTPDAIQIATSLHQSADFFLTNDTRLAAVSQPEMLVLNTLTK
jgi:predicted nucleic acid-binding protein